MRDNIKLYSSVYFHTRNLDDLNGNQKKFSHRLYILVNNVNVFCEEHKKIKHWKFVKNKFQIGCAKCKPKYPSDEWFKKKYGPNWLIHKHKRQEKLKKTRTNSLDWFLKKYGIEGERYYREYCEEMIKRIVKLKKNRYSKISQDLFWKILEGCKNKNDVYFHELNGEFVLRIPPEFNYQKTVMLLDFKHKNKIIEYNGIYWHNQEDDIIRYEILRKMGYDVLVVTSDEYNRNKKSEKIIKKCNNFLTC